MSLLSDKISSYAIDGYATLNYAVTSNPLVIPQTATTLFSNNPTGTSIKIYEPSVSPVGGGGSWKFPIAATGSGFNNTWQGLYANNAQNDGDFSHGVWMKFNSIPEGTLSINQYGMSSAGSTTSGFQFQLAGTLHSTSPGRWRLVAKGITQTLSFGPTIGQWHYLAVTKKADGTMKFYIDNVLVRTQTGLSTATNISSVAIGPSANSGAEYSVNISDYYIAPTSAIDEAQIAEIWAVGNGSPAPRTVKYYNGTDWVNSSGQKVWNGTAWVDWDAKYYDGTQWVNL